MYYSSQNELFIEVVQPHYKNIIKIKELLTLNHQKETSYAWKIW
jgi:hypothetical protein